MRVQFPVRAHASVLGSAPSLGAHKRQQINVSLTSISLSLPNPFLSLTVRILKKSVDVPPHILSSDFTCIWVSVHSQTLQLQTLTPFYLCLRAESQMGRPQKVPSRGRFKALRAPQRLPSTRGRKELVDKHPSFPHSLEKQFYNAVHSSSESPQQD